MTDPLDNLTLRQRGLARLRHAPHLPVAGYVLWVGIRTLTDPDSSGLVSGILTTWGTYSWATALTIGGILVAWGALTGWSRTESTGHALHLVGLTIYATIAAAAGLFGTTLLVVLVTLGAVSALRLWDLAGQREAWGVARRIVRGD